MYIISDNFFIGMKENQLVAKQKPILKVVILGDSNVGKSCLMNRFVSNSFSDNTLHTLGVEFLQKELNVNGIIYTLQVKLIENCIPLVNRKY